MYCTVTKTIRQGRVQVAKPGDKIHVDVVKKNGWGDYVSDAEPTPTSTAFDVRTASVDEVKAHVGDDPAKAADALEVEVSAKNRSTLVDHLKTVAASGT